MATFNTRIGHKYDTEANFANATFSPIKGELIIYAPDSTHSKPRFKVGDGSTAIGSLPFVDIPLPDFTTAENDLVLKIKDGALSWETDNNSVYTLPLATSSARGGIKIGYTATGATIPVQLSSEKAYVALTETAISNAGGITGVTAGNGLTGGATSGTATLNVGAGTGISVTADAVALAPVSTVTAGTYGTASTTTPAHGESITIPTVTVDGYGRVTAVADTTITLPADNNTDTKVTQTVRTTDGEFPILLRGTSAGTTNTTTTTSFASGVTINPFTGKLTADTFYAMKDVVIYGEDDGTWSLTGVMNLKANRNSPAFEGTPTAPTAATGTNNTQLATTAFVQSAIDTKLAANDAMIFKGTIGTGGTVTALPASHNAGWTYKVITAGTYAGIKCEVGDLIICITDRTTANNADWTVVQTNIDGAVTGPTSSNSNHIAIFNGTTGKLIKDGGYAIEDLDKQPHTHDYSVINGIDPLTYTPAGTVTTSLTNGSVTSSAASANSASIYSITGVGSLPSASLSAGSQASWKYTEASQTLEFTTNTLPSLTFNAGSLPTRSSSAYSVSLTTHTHSVSVPTSAKSTFTGTKATLEPTFTQTTTNTSDANY